MFARFVMAHAFCQSEIFEMYLLELGMQVSEVSVIDYDIV